MPVHDPYKYARMSKRTKHCHRCISFVMWFSMFASADSVAVLANLWNGSYMSLTTHHFLQFFHEEA